MNWTQQTQPSYVVCTTYVPLNTWPCDWYVHKHTHTHTHTQAHTSTHTEREREREREREKRERERWEREREREREAVNCIKLKHVFFNGGYCLSLILPWGGSVSPTWLDRLMHLHTRHCLTALLSSGCLTRGKELNTFNEKLFLKLVLNTDFLPWWDGPLKVNRWVQSGICLVVGSTNEKSVKTHPLWYNWLKSVMLYCTRTTRWTLPFMDKAQRELGTFFLLVWWGGGESFVTWNNTCS